MFYHGLKGDEEAEEYDSDIYPDYEVDNNNDDDDDDEQFYCSDDYDNNNINNKDNKKEDAKEHTTHKHTYLNSYDETHTNVGDDNNDMITIRYLKKNRMKYATVENTEL